MQQSPRNPHGGNSCRVSSGVTESEDMKLYSEPQRTPILSNLKLWRLSGTVLASSLSIATYSISVSQTQSGMGLAIMWVIYPVLCALSCEDTILTVGVRSRAGG